MDAEVTPEEVRRLAALADVTVPEDDLMALAASLTAQRALVRPLLDLDLASVPPAVSFDPRWDG